MSLLGNRQAAEFLGISPHSLRAFVQRRIVPHVKIGRRVLFDPEDLRRYIESKKVPVRQAEGRATVGR